MGRHAGPTCRLCRREGVKLFLKGEKCLSVKCPFAKRPYAPGMYYDRAKKLSDYGIHLREKQKVKRLYGMGENQFKRFFKLASLEKNKGLAFLQLLERRLDNILIKCGWAISPNSARQIISHGHIFVNGRKMDISSYIVSKGDVIELRKRLWEIKVPKVSWLEITGTNCTVKDYPTREMIDPGIKENLIIEFYSK